MAESAKRYNSILQIIDDRLIADEVAKKDRGEVFTPLNLVREMLFGIRKSSLEEFKDKMPTVKSTEYIKLIWGLNEKGEFIDDNEDDRIGGIPLAVWRDPDTKWLDPANGIGNFPVVAFYMLDYQLGKHGLKGFNLKGDDNKVKRRRYIVKNMLFMIELNKGNVNTSRKIFDKIVPGVTANICCADTLKMSDEKLKELFGVNKFDVIIGNPPFNSGGIRSKVGEKKDTKTLWPEFIKHSLNWLKDDKYLVFITPNTWIELNSPISKVILENQILSLKSYDVVQSHALFSNESGEIPLVHYSIQKVSSKDDTYIYDSSDNNYKLYNIYTNDFIPSSGISLISKIMKVSKKYGNLEKYYENTQTKDKTHMKEKLQGPYIYPLINISNSKINIKYSDICYKHNNNKGKLVFPNFSMGYPIYDKDGILDGAANMMFTVYADNIETLINIQKLFYTHVVWFILVSLKTKQKFMSNRIFDILPDISNIPNFPKEITDETLIEFFKFDEDDIECINKYKARGEGKLTKEEINYFIKFNINNYITKEEVTEIKKAITLCNISREDKKTRGKKKEGGSRKPHRITRKIRRS